MTGLTGDGLAIHAAILAEPGDDLHRLALADWLEENGEDRLARFVRLQLGVERRPDVERFLFSDLLFRLLADLPFGARCVLAMGGDDTRSSLPVLSYRRGFVAEVVCALDQWLAHGPELVRAHPVERVTLTDREAHLYGPARHGWVFTEGHIDHGSHSLPPGLGDPAFWPGLARDERCGMVWYFTRPGVIGALDAARDALSHALLAWAKSQPTEGDA